MKGFLLGIAVAALAVGGYWLWKNPATLRHQAAAEDGVDAGAAVRGKKKRRARGAARVARAVGSPGGSGARVEAAGNAPAGRAPEPEAEPEPEPVRLTAADLRVVGQGDDLSRPDVVRLDMAEGGDTRELSQDDIDAVFRARESDILGCISSARPDPDTYVPGRVTVKFRIQRTGVVRGVRVEGPAILQKGGLFGCVRAIVLGLRFPPSGGSQVVTYPFTLS